jgi:Tfp pilus assembly protein PilF
MKAGNYIVMLAALALAAAWAPGARAQAEAQAGEETPYNPFLAEKNLEVGTFYLKKKNYDAAIDRFRDALKYKPNFARPHLLMGQAYEKKKEKARAVEHYEKYLEIVPTAPDAEKVRQRIEKLRREIERDKARKARRSG